MKRILKRTAPKFALFLGGALLFSFFSNEFGLVDIQKTAVILAAGIDRSGEGYELTAQISVPKGGEKAGSRRPSLPFPKAPRSPSRPPFPRPWARSSAR